MIVTNNSGNAEKAEYLTTQAKDDPERYIHNEVGYNYRLTNVQAAMGVAQLEKLPEFIKTKKANYEKYKREIDKIEGLYIAEVPDYSSNNYWMYSLQVDKEVYGKDRDEAITRLRRSLDEFVIEGIKTTIPFHRKLIDHEDFKSGMFDTGFLDRTNLLE